MKLSVNDLKRKYYLQKLGLSHSYKSTAVLQQMYFEGRLSGEIKK